MKRMKIGVATWYRRGHNYGSSLQAFAMQRFLQKAYDVELINYNQEHTNFLKIIKSKIKSCYFAIVNKRVIECWKKYEKWVQKNINASKKINKYKELIEYANKYDLTICGSDQIWNNDLKCDPFYFLRFVDRKKRIAYSPSIGRNYIEKSLRELYKEYISDIDYVSVREESSKKLIKDDLNLNVKVCLDSTFLLTREEWENIAKANDKVISKNYLFVYLLEPNNKQIDEIKKYATMNNKKLILPIVNPYYKYDKDAIVIDQFDFLNYLRKSDLVITDSFHGLVFSILYNKKFNLYKRFNDDDKNSQNSRLEDLLNKFQINKDVYVRNSMISEISLNYSEINNKIDECAEESRMFLKEAIKNSVKV